MKVSEDAIELVVHGCVCAVIAGALFALWSIL